MSSTSALPSPSASHLADSDAPPAALAGNPVVAFIIGLCIILLASILNAAGLNLTKLDHVRTSAIPKASRRRDWLRPLWLLGMLLYILSQLVGSTLALEYMRAEYVAPLGSSSLVFNFLFARFLVGTPVTRNDIYGTIVVVLGVVGIVAFGSINSGLATETDVEHLTELWRRGGWLGYFFAMTFALLLLLLFTSTLDAVLAARADLSSVPFAAQARNLQASQAGGTAGVPGALKKGRHMWNRGNNWVGEMLETWTAGKDDKQVAWTLGIGWACCGGGLAGGCLVFAKATVKLTSGSLSHQNTGNQFGHVAPIFTIILLASTAVLQIICLNRGLRVYDSTLVVPVFYGVYTATGFLNSLIFNDDVDAYKSWTLLLIFVSMLVLISGVVLLTHKKPEPHKAPTSVPLPRGRSRKDRSKSTQGTNDEEIDELRGEEEGLGLGREDGDEDDGILWAADGDGQGSDDEEDGSALHLQSLQRSPKLDRRSGEGMGLIGSERARRPTSSDATLLQDPFRDEETHVGRGVANPFEDVEFGKWEDANHGLR